MCLLLSAWDRACHAELLQVDRHPPLLLSNMERCCPTGEDPAPPCVRAHVRASEHLTGKREGGKEAGFERHLARPFHPASEHCLCPGEETEAPSDHKPIRVKAGGLLSTVAGPCLHLEQDKCELNEGMSGWLLCFEAPCTHTHGESHQHSVIASVTLQGRDHDSGAHRGGSGGGGVEGGGPGPRGLQTLPSLPPPR